MGGYPSFDRCLSVGAPCWQSIRYVLCARGTARGLTERDCNQGETRWPASRQPLSPLELRVQYLMVVFIGKSNPSSAIFSISDFLPVPLCFAPPLLPRNFGRDVLKV